MAASDSQKRFEQRRSTSRSSAPALRPQPAQRRSCWRSAQAARGAPVEEISDAPDHVWRRGTSRYDQNILGNTVTDRPARRRALSRVARFHEASRVSWRMSSRVEKLGGERSRWTIKAPRGSVGRAGDHDHRGPSRRGDRLEKRAGIRRSTTEGRVEFISTRRRAAARWCAWSCATTRQAASSARASPSCSSASRKSRRGATSRRFKSLMETGEVATNASPSGRTSETPTEARI